MQLDRLLLIGLSLVAGFGAGALKWRGSAEQFHRDARMAAILAQAGQMPSGSVLVVGDSIAERLSIPILCGKPALNAGIAWSTSKDWLPDIAKVKAAARPSVTVLIIGTNDTDMSDFPKLARFADFAVTPADQGKAAVEQRVIRTVRGPTRTVDGLHPDLQGDAEIKAAIEQGCKVSTAPAR